jgi:hypothetical protein
VEDRLGCICPMPEEPALREAHEPGGSSRIWSVAGLDPAEAYLASCVAEGSILEVRRFSDDEPAGDA